MFKLYNKKVILFISIIVVLICCYLYYNIINNKQINDVDSEDLEKNIPYKNLNINDVREETMDLGQSPQEQPKIDDIN